MKIILYVTLIIITQSIYANELELADKTNEEIIDDRMKTMSIVNKLAQKIYRQLSTEDFESIKKDTLELKKSAVKFKHFFPVNSNGGKAKDLIWENKVLFDEYNDKFINDINNMIINIDDENIDDLNTSFHNMTSNCGTCHKKFKNK